MKGCQRSRDNATVHRLSILTLLLLAGMQVACATAVAAPVPPPPTSADSAVPEDSPARPFLGTYNFIGGQTERDVKNKRLDDGVATLTPLVRAIARSRLTAANEAPDQLIFIGYGKWFEIRVDGRRYASQLDGSPYKVETSTGDVMDLTYKFGETLEQSFSDPAKARINTFELQGDRLIMHVRIRANLLPKDITYDLTFERAAAVSPTP